MNLSTQAWIDHLGLRAHPDEGGYYAPLFVSCDHVLADGRPAMDTIFYMLTKDSPIGHFHRNQSHIVHFFHIGAPLRYVLIDPNGVVTIHDLGPDPRRGEVLQLLVPAGYWKATELPAGEFGLISEAVTPSFDASERVIATRQLLAALYPNLAEGLLRLAYE